jgi:integrase
LTPSTSKSAVERRSEELDTIAAVLPMERRDELAELLTDRDVETLRHLVNQGMGDNTLRALASDLAYLEAWGLAATGQSLPWPAPEALLLKFVAHHLWDPEKKKSDRGHGMPDTVAQSLRDQGFLRSAGPHAPDTVRRRLASWSTLTKWRGLSGAFTSPALKSAVRLAVRATPRPRKRKSAKAVTGDVLAKMLATCSSGSLRDVRDRAILMVAFASGGRRRSEIAGLRVEQISVAPPIEAENGAPLPSRAIHLGRTKTSGADHDEVVYLTGRPVEALDAWIEAAKIESGCVFRKVDRWGNVSKRALEAGAVNAIVKQRAEMAGLNSGEFSAHGLRSGYLTEAANRGIPLPEAMEQSRHRSVQQASSYYNSETRRSGRAARLL